MYKPYLQSILFIIMLLSPVLVFSECIEYRFIDHGDRVEIVCNGSPQSKPNVSGMFNQSYQSEIQVIRNISQFTTVNSCKLLQANHYDAGRSTNIEITVECEVVGPSSEYVEFLLYGLNIRGDRLLTTMLSGYIGGDGNVLLKKVFYAEFDKFINTHKWEPDRNSKTISISNTYISNEKETQFRITQMKQEFADTLSQSNKTGTNSDIIILKKGVEFTHGNHQRLYDCTKCHNTTGGGRISGFGKEWSHKTCKGCHSDKAQGPTSCKGCHK
jgi:hypothetical protein